MEEDAKATNVSDRAEGWPETQRSDMVQSAALDPVAPANGPGPAAPNGDVAMYPYVYAIGRVEPRFPTLSVEKEFAQATGQAQTAGLTDQQVLHSVISQRENRYLARQLCYVFTIEGLDTYLLHPRDPLDLDLLIEALRPSPSPMDLDVVIGIRGPLAPPELCNGLMVPIATFSQIYSFDRDSLIKAIPRPKGVTAEKFEPTAASVFERVIKMVDNAGATDEHRALNYLAIRYPGIYGLAAERYSEDFTLTAVEAQPSVLSGTRNILDVIFSYTNRQTGFTESFFLRVDVTEQFPFLVTKFAPYYEH